MMTEGALGLTNAAIFAHPGADSLVLKGDRIVAIGEAEELVHLRGEAAEWIDLGGRALLPGFIDAHVHLIDTGLSESGWQIDLVGLDRAAALAALEQAVAERGDGEWVIGDGWDESHWGTREYLDRRELDRIAPRSPVIAVRMDGHLLTANSSALRWIEAQGISVPDGSLLDAERGFLREQGAWALLQEIEPDRTTLTEALRAAARLCHRQGVTSVHTMTTARRASVVMSECEPVRLRVAVYLTVDSRWGHEVNGPRGGPNDPWVRFVGAKLFADGSIGAQNAAVGEPYLEGGRGKLNWDERGLRTQIERAERGGCPTAIHAIGDRAIEQVLRLHEEVGTSSSLRHRIEHFELPVGDQMERAGRLGVTVCMQPNFLGNWSGPDKMYEKRLGVARDRACNPLRRVIDTGVRLALGSDGMPISPVYGIHWAVNAPHPGQRLTVEEAIDGYTTAGARLSFEEEVKGRLEPGMMADLVVLDEDPTLRPHVLAERSVEMTFVGGECVYRRDSS